MNPRTLWGCQSVAFMISASVAPSLRFSRSRIRSVLLPSRTAGFFWPLGVLGAFLVEVAFFPDLPFFFATWNLLCAEIPDVVSSIAAALTDKDLDSAYRGVLTVDFSHAVLVPQPHRLLVVRDAVSGWSDLGNPTRVIDTLTRNNPAWLSEMRSQPELSIRTMAYSSASGHDSSRRRLFCGF